MKTKKLTKNSFMQGAFIATFGIVLSKILGIVYVIPFYSIIGESGGALYGYAYNIYSIFLSISTAGIPLAISSITSEYNTLGEYANKELAFKVARKYLSIIGIICFLILFIFAPKIAYLIMGENTGGNSVSDISFVIRIISFSILVVPMLSVYRGYLQGHKFITPTSKSQVLEQLIRVTIIICGSFLVAGVLGFDTRYAVACALAGATIGSVFSLLYLFKIIKDNRTNLNISKKNEIEKATITRKQIFFKILLIAFPFIICDVCKSLYNSVDTFFVVRTLTDLGYETSVSESIMSVISTWGNKLNMIVIAIGTGFAVSLIPNMTASLVKKDYKDIDIKINQTFKTLFFITLPMTLGLSFLSTPIWSLFYGNSFYGPIVFRFSIVVALVTVLLSATQVIALSFKEYKVLLPAVFAGLVLNAVLDIPLMILIDKLGGYAFYGATLSTCLGHILTIIIVMIFITKKYSVNLKETFKSGLLSLFYTLIMLGVLYLISYIVPINVYNRLNGFLVTLFYAVLGSVIYLGISYKTGLIQNIFGKDIVSRILNKLPFKKRGI